MANTSSAIKAAKQAEKNRKKNLKLHNTRKKFRKEVEAAIEAEDKEAADEALSKYNKALGKASKGNKPLHSKKANRLMSRMAQKVNKAFAE